MGLLNLFRRRPYERTAYELYGAVVAQARSPAYYAALGVPDSVLGRFDMVGLFAVLLVRRLTSDADPRGRELSQAVFDAMFADMDHNLREMGVGDLVVGKRIKRLAEAFNGRAHAYDAAIEDPSDLPLLAALSRNVWRSEEIAPGAPALAAHVRAQAAHLASQPLADMLAGVARFLPAAETHPDAAP
ncbi:MAG: ubiquinol-cytochrome C chaperone [Alphaproteobacteria bacterium]|nr:ubiquinol-cytochrome C chaperone [Alphaproteobacteria bacterium]